METQLKLLPINSMARRVHVTVKWLRDESDAGRIPHLRAGRAYLFDPETVERLLMERAQKGSTREPEAQTT